MKRPKCGTASPAQRYAGPGERIMEFSSEAGGGLISLRVVDGRLRVEVYRTDATVDVITPGPAGALWSRDVQPEGVTLAKDRDGDVWHTASDHVWWLPPSGELRSWTEVWDQFGPLTPVTEDDVPAPEEGHPMKTAYIRRPNGRYTAYDATTHEEIVGFRSFGRKYDLTRYLQEAGWQVLARAPRKRMEGLS